MSMLADPRRKQKWSVDPRNSAWSNDDSKFGQKMLERMGWSKGKGLGRTEQGSTDHIKVKVKNNSFGLGTNASNEDNWIAHQDDFNELLTQLNNCHGQNNSSEIPQEDEQKNFSLEEKSKTSKKRVHYMKFTKGKDLSSRTETDLNCIFGKRARSTKDQEQENSCSDSQGETEEVTAPLELDTESITKTVTSTLTMQQYFAQRMARMKKARDPQSEALSTIETSALLEDSSSTQRTENTKVPKKKKKKKKASDELETVEENDAPTITGVGETQEPPKKKKRKTAEAENSTPPTIIEADSEETPPSKKKKKKKKLQKDCEESQLINGHEPMKSNAVTSAMHQKKKKNRRETNSVETLDTDEPPQKKYKKKKKSRKDV
ncbi:PIN2/TERF1-interacting telomerase inhibitor 1 [Gouania willdenowi]|uniref:PIN2/TERF1-interacting telomerase inhibitor 1 n=1 Tax=Gouania willdenowi TaxID=441366 RepID=UPI001055E807|nr:PIN2/TERF1-interacting telomerase inhibitor 1 [Gouania willdenowi]